MPQLQRQYDPADTTTVLPFRQPEKVTRKARKARKLAHLWRRKDENGTPVGPYIIRFCFNKQWLRESTGYDTVVEAEKKRDERIKAFKAQQNGWVSQKGTVTEWWATYESKYIDGGEIKESTRKSHKLTVLPFVLAFGDRRLSTITTDECQGWLAALKARGLADGTRSLHRTNLKAFFAQAIKSHWLRVNPWAGTTSVSGEPRRVILKEHELGAYFSVLGPDDTRFAQVVLESGLRHQEMDFLRPCDVSPTTIHVTREAAKYGRERWVPIQPATYATIEAQRLARGLDRHATARLWDVSRNPATTSLKTRLRVRRRRFERLHATVGLGQITIHDLRRTYGTRCALAGVIPKVLMELMGHKDLQVTMESYIIVGALQTSDAVARVSFARADHHAPNLDRKRKKR